MDCAILRHGVDEVAPVVRSRFMRSKYVIISIVLIGVVSILDSQLFNSQRKPTASSLSAVGTGNRADTAASNAMIQRLTTHLGDVKGLTDMVVLPSSTRNGAYLVSATVDAAQMEGSGTSSWMNSDLDAFFQGVYSASEPIDMAELTFTSGETIIASAGLGKAAYENLASSTMSGDIASALKARSAKNRDGAQSAWFQAPTP